jgi:hypothetical protein
MKVRKYIKYGLYGFNVPNKWYHGHMPMHVYVMYAQVKLMQKRIKHVELPTSTN